MKKIFLQRFAALFISFLSISFSNAVAKPAIVRQPRSQVVAHGGDASFQVMADGAELKYQWLKDGSELGDYENVAGSQKSILRLIGVGQKDAGDYAVVLTTDGGAITSTVVSLQVESHLVFVDDFEKTGTTNWTALKDRRPLIATDSQNHTEGGTRSVTVTNAMQKAFHNLGVELRGRAKASFWAYDNGSSRDFSWYGELRGYTGKGEMAYAAKGGIQQIIAIGRYEVDFGTNNRGSLAGQVFDRNRYQGRVWMGTNAGWFNLDDPGAPTRSPGWHKFEIERLADGRTLQFRVDGVVGKTVTGVERYPFDCIVIGSTGSNSKQGAAWFDDVRVESFPQKFDWESKDSEGKGLFDWMKVRETGTNDTVTDITGTNTVSEAMGASAVRTLGTWAEEGTAIYSTERRGYVEYMLNAPADDSYRIEIEGRERNSKMPRIEMPLDVSIDGEALGRFNLSYTAGTNGFVRCFTPFIKTGPHTVRIYWDNSQSYCSLYLRAVRLQSLQGRDANNNGIKDWVENRLLNQSEIDSAPLSSAVSPVCIEGRGQYLSMMKVSASGAEPTQDCAVFQGAGNRWYSNVPLAVNQPTVISVSHQNGGLEETIEVKWEVTNLLEANDITLRKGDALLLSATPTHEAAAGAVEIQVVGVTNYITDAAAPIEHRFVHAGKFVVEGRFVPTGTARSITVEVIDDAFGGPIATWVNHARYVTFTNFGPDIILEVDPRLKATRVPAATIHGKNAREYSVMNDSAEPRAFVARLGRKGPILDSAPVQGFRVFSTTVTYLRHKQTYRDGNQLIEAGFIVHPVRPEVTIEINVLVAGVTFEDGTLSKTLTATDFNSLGICELRFIRAAGVTTSICHAIKAYQHGVLIGWPTNPK